MQDEQKAAKKAKLIMMAVVVAFILLIGSALINVLMATKSLRIINIDQVESGLSGQEVSDLEGFLWQSLRDSYGFDEQKTEIIALIRPSSLIMTDKDGIKSYEFLIDIDEYKTTFQVSFSLMNGKGFYESPDIVCPVKELRKYPDNCCKGKKVMDINEETCHE